MKQTVYTASPESQQIHVWSLNHDGSLTLTQVVDVPGQVQPMVVSPDKRYLYVGVRPEFRVLAYRIAPDDGALTFAAESALPGSPTHISTDHQGRFVFVGSYNAGSVSVTRLEDGLPVELVDVVEGLDGCHSANISPDNRTLWVPALKQDRICLFDVSDDGHLVAQEPAEVTTVEGAGPRHMAFHPNKQYAYCVNELNSSVDVWELKDPYGKIECVQTLDMMPADFADTRWAADIHITPDGRFLYASERSESFICAMAISETGDYLQPVGYYPTETQPRGFNIDNTGNYLISCGQKSDFASVSRIDKHTGELTELACYPVGKGAMWVTIVTK